MKRDGKVEVVPGVSMDPPRLNKSGSPWTISQVNAVVKTFLEQVENKRSKVLCKGVPLSEY